MDHVSPFTITHCSWPRPVVQEADHWVSEPEWDSPLLPALPILSFRRVAGEPCWLINWCALFGAGLRRHDGHVPGEMRGFHVVFHLKVHVSGILVFWSDDGCIIRRQGTVVHADRATHPPTRDSLTVQAGDLLEIAQWQNYGDWQWGAWLLPSAEALVPYLEAVQTQLMNPSGPPLKVYFGDASPLRAIAAIYSMILNGYQPSRVFVFGDYQWSPNTQRIVTMLLPFAEIVPTEHVLRSLTKGGQPQLADLALNCWGAMKLAISLLYPPHEFCYMDDDVFVLDTVNDALAAFQVNALVFSPDADYSADYLAIWGRRAGCIGRLNTGLYWLRNRRDPTELAAHILSVPSRNKPIWQWEQGFLATQYAGEMFCQLPSQRYFYPYFDGLPGGIHGYDYATNPCGFSTIHFGGLAEKPGDIIALMLAPAILGRRTAAIHPKN
jgi:hypothetical protein